MSNLKHEMAVNKRHAAMGRLAQMLSMLNDALVAEGLTDPSGVKQILAKATPELTREAFNGSNA